LGGTPFVEKWNVVESIAAGAIALLDWLASALTEYSQRDGRFLVPFEAPQSKVPGVSFVPNFMPCPSSRIDLLCEALIERYATRRDSDAHDARQSQGRE
jgi:hypothetical protein